MPLPTEVKYLVLPSATDPYLLARVRWPDVCQAISVGRPDWQEDPGLFDLPYDPGSTLVSLSEADAIAAAWGARLPSDEAAQAPEASLIRRMPANWSDLSPAEKRAWSLDHVTVRPRAAAGRQDSRHRRATAALAARLERRRELRRASDPLSEQPTADDGSEVDDPFVCAFVEATADVGSPDQ